MTKTNGIPFSLRFAYWVFTILMLFAWVSIAHAARTEKAIHFFWNPVGITPNGLLLSPSGTLYGVTSYGGANSAGLVYELIESGGVWKETILYTFTGGSDGANPFGPLVMDAAGNLYGTAGSGGTQYFGVVFELSPSGGTWTETVLHNFTGASDGGGPSGGVVFDTAGNLYGTASFGGIARCNHDLNGYCGVVFQLSPSDNGWTEHVLYNFTGLADGSDPQSGVILDSSGNIYGTTFHSGGKTGAGAAFELTFSDGVWHESVLHDFSYGGSDGFYPTGSLVLDESGNLYGVTEEGGTGAYGTVFELTPGSAGWTETILHNFTGGNDGAYPASVILGKTAIYGVTSQGGTGSCPYGGGEVTCGTVFELTSTNGWTKKKIYNFHGAPDDGGVPNPGLILDSAGHLFGTLFTGGGNLSMAGGVFEVNP